MNITEIKEEEIYVVRLDNGRELRMRCDGVSLLNDDGTPALYAVNDLHSGCYEATPEQFLRKA